MNSIARNMEAIFIAAVLLAGATGLATAAVPAFHGKQALARTDGMVHVVSVSAKRLSAAEKLAAE